MNSAEFEIKIIQGLILKKYLSFQPAQIFNRSRTVSVVILGTLLVHTANASGEQRPPEKVFEDTCGYCHGHYIAPGIAVSPEIRGRSLPPALTKTFVRNGTAVMPAFRHTEITDAELEALATWINTSKAPKLPVPPTEAANEH